MAYNPNPARGPVRDKAYPSQIAAERPALVTRIHCQDSPDPDETLRGGEHEMHGSDAVREFNHRLRSGHGFRNSGDE